MHETGHAGQNYRVHDISPDIDFRWEAVEKQQQHHDDAARSHRRHPNQKTGEKTDRHHPRKSLHRWRSIGYALFNPPLEQHQEWNDDEQHTHRALNEVVYSVTIEVTDMHQQLYTTD